MKGRGFTDAAFFLNHYMTGNGETLYFGSRLVEMIETDAAPFMKEWRTEYLSYAAQQMKGKAGSLPLAGDEDFLSNASGIPEGYAARVYPISEKTYIATGGFWLARLYSGAVEERNEGKYYISLMTEFDVNKPYNFDVKNVEQYPPDTDYEDISLNPPAPYNIPGTNWTIYFPDEWGKALEDEGHAVRFDAKGAWAREELLIAVDRNCNGWDVGDIEIGPIIIKAWLPTSVNPTQSKSNMWVWFS